MTATARIAALVPDLLARGYAVQFRAEGVSMSPAIQWGDLLRVTPVSQLCPGDVLLCRYREGLVAHRFEGREPDGRLRLRGDRGWSGELVPPSAVLGRVASVVRDGRVLPVRRTPWLLRAVRCFRAGRLIAEPAGTA